MNVTLIGFVAFCFVGLTFIQKVLESQVLSTNILSKLTVTYTYDWNIAGLTISLPVPNIEFFTEGIPSLLRWDYSFFGGGGAIFAYFLYSVTVAVSFGLALTLLGTVINAFGRR
jgi:hypothetical protein